MQRQEVHPPPPRLVAIELRQHGPLEKRADLIVERAARNLGDQPPEAEHGHRIALLGRLLAADAFHQANAAEPVDELIDRGNRLVARALALVVLEAAAVPPEREKTGHLPEELRFRAERALIREREGDAELVEEVHQCRLAGAAELRLIELHEDAGEGARVVERAVRAAGVDRELPALVDQLPARRVEIARERQRIVGAELESLAERSHDALENPEIELVAVVRDDDVIAAES